MRASETLSWLRDTALRMFPHATRPGLRPIGTPGPDSPVLVTGNFTLTVDRLRRTLSGRDVWLLVADSRGINVWCAAGGGHLTDHDVIAALRSSRVGDKVHHRDLVLPQLAATGVERHKVDRATGWKARWGPARMEDIPEFLDRGCRVTKQHRAVRFPVWERFEMASIWALPLAVLSLPALGLLFNWTFGALTASVLVLTIAATFAAIPYVPIVGASRWLTFGAAAVAGTAAGSAALAALGMLTTAHLLTLAGMCVGAMLVLSIDITGTTPWYPGGVNSFQNQYTIELVAERCTGVAECVQVCPKDVLTMNGARRIVEIAQPDECMGCGACIVQCPEDALRFRFEDGRIVEPATVRSTRLNMVGRRTVELDSANEL